MSQLVTVLKGSTGLNTKVDPVRLQYDSKAGVAELAEAVNVCIDDTGRIRRRKGTTATNQTSATHSLFVGDTGGYFVSAGDLYKMNGDFLSTLIKAGVGNTRMSYAEYAGRLFFANGVTNGAVSGNTASAWQASYVGPETTKNLVPPPVGSHLAVFNASILIARDTAVWMTRNFDPYHVDATRGVFPFSNTVLMVRPVDDGFYVGTTAAIYFIAQTGPSDYQLQKKANYPPVEWTDVEVDASLVAKVNQTGQAGMCVTTQGICYLGHGGAFANMTQDKIDLPSTTTGSAVFHDGEYIACLHP